MRRGKTMFAMANAGIEMLLERQRGLWRRLRSAPVSRLTLLAGRGASGAIISLLIPVAGTIARHIVTLHQHASGTGSWGAPHVPAMTVDENQI